MNEMYAAEIRRTEGAAEAEKFLADATLLLTLGILLVGCMAHVRRRFFRTFETVYKNRPGSPGGVTCNTVMDLIAELYRIEDELRRMDGLSEKEFLELRKKRAVPVIRRLKDYAKERQPLHTAEPKLSEAISYLLSQIDTIANYLESPDLTPDNNSQERLIKTVCTTRKASMFASTEEGAASWALYHSLLQTAILNNVNPTLYLKSVLNAVAKANDVGTSAKDMNWESLMPWNFRDKIPLIAK
jgi:transposase